MYKAIPGRYDSMIYNRSGKSGLLLPAVSLGLWHNFGSVDDFDTARHILLHAFDRGITHFDLANNYGPEPGSAEETLGKVLASDLGAYRDELIISTKAGYDMWEGPYGNWGSRKHLLASLDQSLNRMGLEYVDIFYSHRPDPDTPIEETLLALSHAVKSGKALYAGVSRYDEEQTRYAAEFMRKEGTPLLISQPKYNMLDREIESGIYGGKKGAGMPGTGNDANMPVEEINSRISGGGKGLSIQGKEKDTGIQGKEKDTGILNVLKDEGIGCIVFSPLAQGLLTDKYLGGIPAGSRAARPEGYLQESVITPELQNKLSALNKIALDRGQTLAQMALVWALRHKGITSVLIGTRNTDQLDDSLGCLEKRGFSEDELHEIDKILST